jgi:hypothetical protein
MRAAQILADDCRECIYIVERCDGYRTISSEVIFAADLKSFDTVEYGFTPSSSDK